MLANGSLDSGGSEYEIRKQMIKNDKIEAIITLPNKLFYTTDISVTCWILNNNKKERIESRGNEKVIYRDRSGEILFMDLRKIGHPYEKKFIEFTEDDRKLIVDKFISWRQKTDSIYTDEVEFCHSANAGEIIENDFCLLPSKYIEFNIKKQSKLK